jgi:hypothetical protein
VERVKKLGFHGDVKKEFVEVKVACHSDHEFARYGPIEVTLPLELKDGPCYKIILKCVIVTPEVNISKEKIDFGRILCGHCKVGVDIVALNCRL